MKIDLTGIPDPKKQKPVELHQVQLPIEKRQLESRKGVDSLPLSIDRLPKNILEKTIHNLDSKYDWESVGKIKLQDTELLNFMEALHSVDTAKIEKKIVDNMK